MNTNRKEIAAFRNSGMFEQLGRELCRAGVVFEYIYTGGGIYLILVGKNDGAHILIDEHGETFAYKGEDESEFKQLHRGHGEGPLNDRDVELDRVAREVAYTVLGALAGSKIDQSRDLERSSISLAVC